MAIIYNFLNNVWQQLKLENKQNFAFVFVVLLLLSLPFKLAVTNVILIVFGLLIILNLKKLSFKFNKALLLPIILFGIMSASLLWSIDLKNSIKALPKEVFLLIIPFVFYWIPSFTTSQKIKITQFYSYGFIVIALFFMIRAVIRYFLYNNAAVFFYHQDGDTEFGLIPKELNAIHFSVFSTLAFVYLMTHEVKNNWQKTALLIILVFIILLSSKNILLILILLAGLYFFYYSKSAHKLRLRNLIIFIFIVAGITFFSKIKNRFQIEFQANNKNSISNDVVEFGKLNQHNVSIYEAFFSTNFTPNDNFNGTAFRVYQARMFVEFLQEENILFKGFGLNASQIKLEEKGIHYNVYQGTGKEDGYQNKNFHNQYLQNFAELGIFGFLILIIMLFLSTKKAIKNKDFVHLAFSILMISVFLTESFLWRQRGVVFFALFYCLFMSQDLVSFKKTNN